MILVPSSLALPETRLYRDSADPKVAYLDLHRAKPVRGAEALRWLPVSPRDAYLMGEVRFGPDAGEFAGAPEPAPNARLLPMPWGAAPVWVWSRDGDVARVVARGSTSGFGIANAVLNGAAPLAAVGAPIMVAAELSCSARLAAPRLLGSGRPMVAEWVAERAALGRRAVWSATVAEAVLSALEEAEAEGLLELRMEPPPASAEAAELRALVFLEWAHRLAVAARPAAESLAMPASGIQRLQLPEPPDFQIQWSPGSTVQLRAIRLLTPGGAIAPVMEVRPDGAGAQAGPA